MTAADSFKYAVIGGTDEFWRFARGSALWTQLPSVPSAGKNGKLKDGASLSSLRFGETTSVYLLHGSRTGKFARYNVTWQSRNWCPHAPYDPRDCKMFHDGSVLIAYPKSEVVFALKSRTSEFYRHNPEAERWSTCAGLPGRGTSGRKRMARGQPGCRRRRHLHNQGRGLQWTLGP